MKRSPKFCNGKLISTNYNELTINSNSVFCVNPNQTSIGLKKYILVTRQAVFNTRSFKYLNIESNTKWQGALAMYCIF